MLLNSLKKMVALVDEVLAGVKAASEGTLARIMRRLMVTKDLEGEEEDSVEVTGLEETDKEEAITQVVDEVASAATEVVVLATEEASGIEVEALEAEVVIAVDSEATEAEALATVVEDLVEEEVSEETEEADTEEEAALVGVEALAADATSETTNSEAEGSEETLMPTLPVQVLHPHLLQNQPNPKQSI